VLASSIGSDYSPEGLAAFVRQGKFSLVVIDWAWITYHWDKTDFPALNRFLDLMAAQGVLVAAMYRPRFLDQPTVPTQVDATGKPAASHGYYICFSSPEARQWGISWGTRILQQCPQINEIIIYNPLNQCQCPACQAAARGNPYAHYDAVWKFLAEAKAAWRTQKASVKLGVVFVSDPEFWKRGAQALDVAHPFLFVMDDTDMPRDAAAAGAIRDLLPGKMGSCLAKVTWGPEDKVSPARLAQFDRVAAAAGLPYFFWTFETLFTSDLYDPKAVAQALGLDPAAMTAALAKMQGRAAAAEAAAAPSSQAADTSALGSVPAASPVMDLGKPNGRVYPGEQIRSTSAKVFLDRMVTPEANYDSFAACHALVTKARESDAEGRGAVVAAVGAAMKNTRWPEYPRWLCCYILSSIGDARAVPDLSQVLLHDGSEVVRTVAAEAMADLEARSKSPAAHDALVQAADQEQSARVREVLARRLGQTLPTSAPATAPEAAAGQSGAASYTAEEIKRTSAEVFLERMLQPEPGYDRFAAMNALAQKAKESEAATRRQILSLAIAAMKDTRRPVYQRWQCCYVLSGSGDEQVVPELIEVLLHDDSEVMRGVAVDALAEFPQNAAAHDALLQAARRETSENVREALRRNLGEAAPAGPPPPAPVEDRAPTGPPQPPPGPALPVTKPLPWPCPGGEEDQIIFNNYQQATDIYIHCGLDFIQPAGTPVMAVDSGYVAAIYTNYPDWTTHYFFIVTPKRGGNEGWCYTHLDPRTFTFKEGDYVEQGESLGSLVDFSVGNQPGVSHLHLHYVRFSRDASGKVNVHSLLDPLYFFDWKDTEPPVFQPLRFVTEDMAEQFPADAAGVVTVSGRVDVLAAVTDSAYPGHMGNLGVPVVMLSISDGKHTMQELVVDHRGDVGDETQVKPLYLSYDQKKVFLDPDSFPRYQMLRVTKTDGDGRIEPRDGTECWNTAERDQRGKPLWPNGQYSVNVYAWDIAGNRAVVGAVVRVRNR
jgi:murein DD-endopeptidase MepM/ murein hydrolase activator NlpD